MALSDAQRAQFDFVCALLSETTSARKAFEHPDCPIDKATFYRWLEADQVGDLRDQYARATEARADTWVEQMFDIADQAAPEVIKDDNGKVVRMDYSPIHRAKLQLDLRKWAAGKAAPKKYGDRQTIDVNHGVQEGAIGALAQELLTLAGKLGVTIPPEVLRVAEGATSDDGTDHEE